MTLVRAERRTHRWAARHNRSRPTMPGRFSWSAVTRATVSVMLLGMLWRTARYALAFPLWGDEAFVAVTLLERDLAGLSHPPEFYQIVPPGFLWAEWLAVRWVGSGEWALRLIPF